MQLIVPMPCDFKLWWMYFILLSKNSSSHKLGVGAYTEEVSIHYMPTLNSWIWYEVTTYSKSTDSTVQGFHVYKSLWTPEVRELSTVLVWDNAHDHLQFLDCEVHHCLQMIYSTVTAIAQRVSCTCGKFKLQRYRSNSVVGMCICVQVTLKHIPQHLCEPHHSGLQAYCKSLWLPPPPLDEPSLSPRTA